LKIINTYTRNIAIKYRKQENADKDYP
jgi:hypothetical protein